jgi:hypothetical protein
MQGKHHRIGDFMSMIVRKSFKDAWDMNTDVKVLKYSSIIEPLYHCREGALIQGKQSIERVLCPPSQSEPNQLSYSVV